jgi:SAM-dependent methyltransferase
MKPEDMLAIRGRALADIYSMSGTVIRDELSEQMAAALQWTVGAGPFAGMKIVTDASWGDGIVIPKLFGCYEQELHSALSRAVARLPTLVIDIGCAEGYYAIGLARLLPKARVIAFDIDPKAQEICRAVASKNGVADRIRVEGECSPNNLAALVAAEDKKLLVVDCEGAERSLLTADVIRQMRNTDVIVECHDFMDAGITSALTGLFAQSHDVERIDQGGRNPNLYTPLRQLSEIYRWLVLCEFRPVTMNWLACWAR